MQKQRKGTASLQCRLDRPSINLNQEIVDENIVSNCYTDGLADHERNELYFTNFFYKIS